MTTYANMNISSPDVGATDYEDTVEDTTSKIDAHDHTTGKGVQIPSAGIEDDAITADKILADAVTTAKIADDAVTTAKMAINYALSSGIIDNGVSATSPTVFQTAGSVDVDVTITLEGDRDLELSLVGVTDGSDFPSVALLAGTGGGLCSFDFYDGSTAYNCAEIESSPTSSATTRIPPHCIKLIIPAGTFAAGAKTFSLRGDCTSGSSGVIRASKIMAREL